MTDPYCDPETGECTPAPLNETGAPGKTTEPARIIYVGDPMCSWCWGISPELKALQNHFSHVPFQIVMGGLRPGGGDPWNDQMKDFLMHHWKEVNHRSGQPFGYDLFDRASFNYDTEPPCRAVVAAREWLGKSELAFFEAIQKKFYVESQDPNEEIFYQEICEQFNIDFSQFLKKFRSEAIKKATHREFLLNRQWGVRGYPTTLLQKHEQLSMISHGYASFEQMKERIEGLLERLVA